MRRVTGRWNPWVTGLLPLLLGSAILLTSIWLLAYVGWLALYVLHGPTVLLVQPPSFGSSRLFARKLVARGYGKQVVGEAGLGTLREVGSGHARGHVAPTSDVRTTHDVCRKP